MGTDNIGFDGFSDEQIKVSTKMQKCETCGSNMVYDPERNQLLCEHCGGVKIITSKGTANELSLLQAFDKDEKWGETEPVVFKCTNCGARVVLTDGKTATDCPFCGTAHVQKSSELAGLKPNALIPFSFGVDKALSFSKEWAKKGLFTANKFKKNLNAQNLKGVFAPCFTFDSFTNSTYSGRIGTTHTRVVGSGKNRRTETYTVWRNIGGRYKSSFDDILITAGTQFEQRKLDKLSPFYTNASVNYSEEYMLGYMAYHYDEDITKCWESAKHIIDRQLKDEILSQYVYDKLAYFNIQTEHQNVTYKYVMLPVYMGNYRFNKKNYNFSINGATGKVYGKRPKSPSKILIAIGIGLAIIGAIGYLIFKSSIG